MSSSPKSNNRALIVLILAPILFCCFCCAATLIFSSLLPTSLTLTSSPTAAWSSTEPSQTIKFDCVNVEKLTLNGKQLSTAEMEAICRGNGLTVDLKNGENDLRFEASGSRGQAAMDLKVSFDQAEYQKRAAAEKQKLEDKQRKESEEKQKQEAERAKAEAEAKAKAQVEAGKLKKGQVISGVSIQQIWDEHDKQKKLSDVKAQLYLESLKGQSIVWVGEVQRVTTRLFGAGYYIDVDMGGGLFNSQSFTIDDDRQKLGDLNEGQLIKVTAKIDDASGLTGVSIHVRDAQVEVVKD